MRIICRTPRSRVKLSDSTKMAHTIGPKQIKKIQAGKILKLATQIKQKMTDEKNTMRAIRGRYFLLWISKQSGFRSLAFISNKISQMLVSRKEFLTLGLS